MTGDEHGASRYRSGCRCVVCRAANTRRVREWRARKRSPEPVVSAELPEPPADLPTPSARFGAGPIETALLAELEALVGEPPWRVPLEQLLLLNARLLDQVHVHGRYDIISGLQTRTLQMFDRIRALDPNGGGDLEALMRDLNNPSN